MSMQFDDARIATLKHAFESAASADGTLERRAAYQLIFNAEERAEYSFGSFEEDLNSTNAEAGESLTFADVEKFLKDNL